MTRVILTMVKYAITNFKINFNYHLLQIKVKF